MSADIDCAVITTAHHESWMHEWLARHHGMRRLQLTAVSLSTAAFTDAPPAASTTGPEPGLPVSALRDTCHTLYRYQVCLLPVDATTLSWVRTALSSLSDELPLPLVCITRALKAEAIGDLFRFGLIDFIDQHASGDEIRARCTEVVRNVNRCRRGAASSPTGTAMALPYSPVMDAPSGGLADGHALYWPGMEASIQGTMPAPWQGATERTPRCRRQRTSERMIDATPPRSPARPAGCIGGMRTQPNGRAVQAETSFRQAKQRVVDHFEAQFLRTALAQHRGNVAGAARACAKHRRAFWALMRKHGIDANTFRKNPVTMSLG